MLRWSSDCVLSFLYSQILPYEIFFRTSLISPVRGLSDKKLRLGVDFWCEWKYTVPSLDGDGNEVEGEVQTKTETVEVQ